MKMNIALLNKRGFVLFNVAENPQFKIGDKKGLITILQNTPFAFLLSMVKYW